MQTKEELLTDIEKLLTYKPEEKTTINPNYLEYLTLEDLHSIKKNLMERIGQLSEEDVQWLEQFKKYE
ncbi:MAG TPA: hypothetical protein ENK94_01255 [Campylobacterales bacterium]|nr:hypothetical protein [Campylobacterales bacterium]